jgi:hypothetical protein
MMMMINDDDDDNGDGAFQDSGDLYIIFTAHYSRGTRFQMQIPGISLQITLTLVRDVHRIFTKFANLSPVW